MAMRECPLLVRRTLLVLVLVVLLPGAVDAYTPDSPQVRAMLDRAIAYLGTSPEGGTYAGRLGGRALVGLASYKYRRRYFGAVPELPRETATVMAEVKRMAHVESGELTRLDNYSLALALILLAEIRPNDHRVEVSLLFNEVVRRQQSNGSWTYRGMAKGDTSQTQYGVLAVWSARNAGLEIPSSLMDQVTNWLIRTQTPEGGWGYHPVDPGSYVRMNQEQVKIGRVAAALGCLYVASDFLGLSQEPRDRRRGPGDLPPALVPVRDDSSASRRRRIGTAVDVNLLEQSIEDGNAWLRRNFTMRPVHWQFYYLYTLERYHSFRELVTGRFEAQPRWYNDGIRLLMELQEPSGALYRPTGGAIQGGDRPVSTAFGILFAIRSTQESISNTQEQEGILRGGYGMPSDVSEARLKGSRIVAPAITGEVNDMVSMLEEEDSDEIQNLLENPEALRLSRIEGDATALTSRLWRILRTGSYRARIIAARALGEQGKLDDVPILIYALTDPDPRVVREARDGLRLISRKLQGFGLSDNPDKDDIKLAVDRWKAWYKTVRPDAVFVD